MECGDGTYCNGEKDVERWSCCNNKGGRAKCPKNYPNMCKSRTCAGNKEYCCQKDGICEEKYGGTRMCRGKRNHTNNQFEI